MSFQLIMSLKELCAKSFAPLLKPEHLAIIPNDLHDTLRKQLDKGQQIALWNGEYKYWMSNGQLCKHCFYKDNLKHGEYKTWCINVMQ